MNNNNITIAPFDLETQKKIFDIFYAEFSEKIATDNCFLLAQVGQKLSKPLQEAGLKGAKANVFRACPEYFLCGYDSEKQINGCYADALAVTGYETPQRFVTQKEAGTHSKNSLANKLKNHFKQNEVPFQTVGKYLKKISVSYTNLSAFLK
ncbi:MAG: hypothetical protein IJ367_01095 [Clostridia bacterium]|nr:hypothetical protein [Clostridia bacterium]